MLGQSGFVMKWLVIFGVFALMLSQGVVAQTVSSTPEDTELSADELGVAALSDSALATADSRNAIDAEQPVASIIDNALRSVPGFDEGLSGGISVMIVLTVIALAPSIVIMTTSFTRIVIVLSLLRQAMGTQGLPPSQVLVGLSLFLTLLVMTPTLDRINNDALQPLNRGEINEIQAWNVGKEHVKYFMLSQIAYTENYNDIYMIEQYRGRDTSDFASMKMEDLDMVTVIPAFILSELKTAFVMGFRIYLPFLIIDMVIASVLISMGMLMLPPVLISLPFKLLMFVLVDGWRLIVGNLLMSFDNGLQ